MCFCAYQNPDWLISWKMSAPLHRSQGSEVDQCLSGLTAVLSRNGRVVMALREPHALSQAPPTQLQPNLSLQ